MEQGTFTPSWLDKGPKDKRPKFSIRQASIIDRDRFEAELDGDYNAGLIMRWEFHDLIKNGIRGLLKDDPAVEELIAVVDAEYSGQDLSVAERQKVRAAEEVLRQHWPEYQAARRREADRNAILPTLAFARFVTGWENVKDAKGEPVEYARTDLDEIPDDVLRRIPLMVLRSVGIEAYQRQYGSTETKN